MPEVSVSGEGEMKYILAIIAVEALTEIFVESALFDSFRVWLGRRHWLIDELVTCGWCVSVWAAIIVFALLWYGLWWILAVIAIHRVSNFLHDIFGLLKRFKRVEDEEEW